MTEPLLEAVELRRYYQLRQGWFQRATVKALDGVSFRLQPRRTLAVVGESGCGKSTLARLLTLIEPPTSGALRLLGRNLIGLNGRAQRAVRRQAQIVFQNPFSSLNPRKTIGAILQEPLAINTRATARERREQAQAMLAQVGLRPEHYDRYPHMFSGGQRQRIAIARALMLKPPLVVADEPVSALDVSIQAQVLNLLLDLQDQFGVAYVFISHDLSVVRHIADELLVLYLGRPVEQGPKDVIFEQPLHPYTQALLASAPRLEPTQRRPRGVLTGDQPSPLNPPSGCAFHSRCPFATAACARIRPDLRWLAGRWVACHHAEPQAAP